MNRKTIFDAIRRLLGRGFTQAEVDELDEAIRMAEGGNPTRAIGDRGLSLIKRFEGCARLRADGLVEAYPDPGTGGEPWTIGWGATGEGIEPGTVWTHAECDARLAEDLKRYAADVERALAGAPCTAGQFDALVSFHYNTGAIGWATLTKKHREGDYRGAKAEFGKWTRADGKILPGLVKRRAAEAELYATDLA